MAKRGAKGKYEKYVKPYLKEINEKVIQGITEEQIAHALGISVASLNNYRNRYPELAEALSKDKGASVLIDLVHAGIKAAIGGFEELEETVTTTDKEGKTVTVHTKKQVYIPPNAALNKYYVNNFGKSLGYTSEPLQYELAKDKHEFQKKIEQEKNWDLNLKNYNK